MGRTRGSLLTIAACALLLAALGVGTVGCGDSHSACTASVTNLYCTRLIVGPDAGYNACTDVGTAEICEDGAWKCPAGSVPEEQCDCEGPGAPQSCESQADGGSSGG